MKIVMIYDQIQAGAGTKDDKMIGLNASREVIGPAVMMEPYLKKVSAKVIGCLYCGDGYFQANEAEVLRKFGAMINKLQPDIVICGPSYNYEGYSEMAIKTAVAIKMIAGVPAICAMASQNAQLIDDYRGLVPIVKTPKKGGVGLTEALQGIVKVADALVTNRDVEKVRQKYCFN